MTELDTTRADLDGAADPGWVRPTVAAAVLWLWRSYGTATATAYANHLGIPRGEQRWRAAGSRNQHRAGPSATAWFPWCQRAGLDPHRDMTRDALQVWVSEMDRAGLSKSTQNARLGAVAAWYAEQRYQGTSGFNPSDALPQARRQSLGVSRPEPARPTVPLTLAQVRALRVAADLDPGQCRLRNRAVVAVLVSTGIRAAELCGLTRADVYRTGPNGAPALWVDGKGGHRRWVALPAMALDTIDEYLHARDAADAGSDLALPGQVIAGQHEQRVFTTVSGRPLEPQHVTGALRYLCRVLTTRRYTSSTVRGHAAHLRPIEGTVHPHQLRHFYATTAEAHGVPVRQVRADLGHSSVAITETYLARGRDLDSSAVSTVADLITAGEELTLVNPQHTEPVAGNADTDTNDQQAQEDQ